MNGNEINELNELMLDIDLIELVRKIDKSVNIYDILKITDYEIRHSNMLAWLFDPNENHDLGSKFIELLIDWLVNENGYITSAKEKNKLLRCNYDSFIVLREWNKIDLLLYSLVDKIVIVIENKIMSKESCNQLFKYKNKIMKKYPEYKSYFLYLTLYGDVSSDPQVWWSIGYDEVAKWIEKILKTQFYNIEVKQILQQYFSVLRRKIMGYYSDDVIKLCNKIYTTHKKALDIIFDLMDFYPTGVSEIKEWFEEWEETNKICFLEIHKNHLAFRTPKLEELFPSVEGYDWPCYYWIWPIPFPKQISLEFNRKILYSEQLDKNLINKFQIIKTHYNKKIKKDWKSHILKSWILKYNPTEISDFASISNDLKMELERIIINDIKKYEAELRKIIKIAH